uniref:Uncharacterized protein n=1 Tax=Rhizophora mucronata TaxID=61149 RepID=A0A2P2QTZ0_RHIMU
MLLYHYIKRENTHNRNSHIQKTKVQCNTSTSNPTPQIHVTAVTINSN